MKKSLEVLVAVAIAGVAFVNTAGAETRSHQFQVKLVVQASCTFGTSSLSLLDLGSHATNANVPEQTGNLIVNCTNGAAPIIKMDSGTAWKLTDTKGGEIGYQILRPDGNVWNTSQGYSYVSSGSDEVIPVKAKVANSGNKAGIFTDKVTVSVDF